MEGPRSHPLGRGEYTAHLDWCAMQRLDGYGLWQPHLGLGKTMPARYVVSGS